MLSASAEQTIIFNIMQSEMDQLTPNVCLKVSESANESCLLGVEF